MGIQHLLCYTGGMFESHLVEYLPGILSILLKELQNMFFRPSMLWMVSCLVIGEWLLYGPEKGVQICCGLEKD